MRGASRQMNAQYSGRRARLACEVNFVRDRRGNIAPIFALLLIPIIAVLGVATEASGWYFTQGSLQNATDAAAMAAAANIANGGTAADCNSTDTAAAGTPCAEVRAVFAKYGYANGANNISVTTKKTGVTCPSGSVLGTCYRVEVTKLFPIRLLAVAGFRGNTQIGSARYQSIPAAALVGQSITTGRPYCLLALNSSPGVAAFDTRGVPKADLSGCNVMSNSDGNCTGQGPDADVADAHGSIDSKCGDSTNNSVPIVSDPYAGLAGNIPSDPCGGSYPGQTILGVQTWSGFQPICGNLTVSADATIEHDTTLVIYNGNLNVPSGKSLTTIAGVSATIIFAGTNSASYGHIPVGGGTLDIKAPTSGVWSNLVMYQAPTLTQNVNITEAGNSPTWKLTGVVYLPNSDLEFKGAVNKSSNGQSCFALVADTISIKGTGFSLAHGDCSAAGMTLPSGSMPGRMVLLQ